MQRKKIIQRKMKKFPQFSNEKNVVFLCYFEVKIAKEKIQKDKSIQ